MASACMPLTYVRAVSPAADTRSVVKSVQCKHVTGLQSARPSRVSTQGSLAGFCPFNANKTRGHTALAFDNSDFKPFTVEELEQSLASDTFSDSRVESQSDSSESDFASPDQSDLSSESGFSEVEPPQLTKLFVGNLPLNFENQHLEELFKQHGSVFVAEVVLDKDTGGSRGFGFVYMNSPQDAEVVIQKLNGKDVGGRPLKVNYQESAEERLQRLSKNVEANSNVNKLFVGNLPWNVTDLDLEQLFSEFGTVVRARVIYDRDTRRSKGFGFVSFSSADAVSTALTAVNGWEYIGRQLKVAMAGDKPASRPPSF